MNVLTKFSVWIYYHQGYEPGDRMNSYKIMKSLKSTRKKVPNFHISGQ